MNGFYFQKYPERRVQLVNKLEELGYKIEYTERDENDPTYVVGHGQVMVVSW